MSRVSVIIPTYNCARFISESIDSVINQSYRDFEILVVDDGSEDNTHEVLQPYISKSLIRYFYQENRGVSAARNLGIRQSRGKYIAFLDADDIWLSDKLKLQIYIMDNNPGIAIIFTDGEAFDEKRVVIHSLLHSRTPSPEGSFIRGVLQRKFNDGALLKDNIYSELLLGNFIITQSVLVNKKHFGKIGYFDENLCVAEDYDLWIRLAKKYQFLYFNKVTVRCRVRDNGLSGSLRIRMYRWAEWDGQIFEKYYRECLGEYKNLFKRRIIESYKTAYHSYFNMNNLKNARRVCFRCLIYDKLQIKLYFYIIISFLPIWLINYLRKSKKIRYN